MSDVVTAFAPASIGNVAVGFDMLGLALADVGDRVSARKTESPGVMVAEVRGMDGELHPYLSANADENTASIAVQALWDVYGSDGGVELKVYKGVPLQSGMGSSAASAVAAVVAVNACMIFCPEVLLPEVIRLPVPSGVSSVLMHPDLQVNTAQARKGLARGIAMKQWLRQQGYMGAFIAACASSDLPMISKSLKDVVIEPQRTVAVSCFDAVKEAAMGSGALGFSLSGSGPSLFALCEDSKAGNLATAMEQACRGQGIQCQSWVSPMDAPGAHLVD
jgi:homoserine kinase